MADVFWVQEDETVKIQVTRESFEAAVGRPGIVLIDCWASWCAACKDFAPVFDRVAERRSQHVFGTLNTHEEADLTESLNVSHIPTLMLFRDGVLLFRQPGYVDEDGLDDILDQAEGLDMNVVRADMAAADDEKN